MVGRVRSLGVWLQGLGALRLVLAHWSVGKPPLLTG